VLEEGSVGNSRAALSELSGRYPKALIVMEAGCHSPWVSRHLEQAGCEVIVSNPRKTRAIYQHERKSDWRDALMLARIARMEPALLYPVQHGSEEAQQDLLRIKLRDSLVRVRVGLINSLLFTLKSLGYTMANPSTERFHKSIKSALPESVVQMITPSVQAIEELFLRIKLLDREIRTLAHSKYPDTAWLEQIPRVGPITALYFVLKIGDPARFKRV
jgi:transposase